jgi:hypothetical protein
MTTLRDSLLLRTAPDLISSSFVIGSVIFRPEDGCFFTVNEAGAALWEHLSQPQTVAALRTLLLDEFDVSPEQGEADLIRFITQLHAAHLVEIVDETDP